MSFWSVYPRFTHVSSLKVARNVGKRTPSSYMLLCAANNTDVLISVFFPDQTTGVALKFSLLFCLFSSVFASPHLLSAIQRCHLLPYRRKSYHGWSLGIKCMKLAYLE